MKFVFLSCQYTPQFSTPQEWLTRIEAYVGILEALSEQHRVISIEQINYTGVYAHNGVTYHFIKSDNRIFPRQLHRLVKELKPDVVVVHGLHVPHLILQLRLQLGKRIKIMVQHHAEKPFSGLKKSLQQLADRFVGAYLFASDQIGLDWVKRGNLADSKKNHEVMEASSVFFPMNKDLAKAKTGVSGEPVYLWVGRLDLNKDPITVVKAFLQFSEVQPSARLYLIYHTDELLPQLQMLVQQSGKEKVVQFVGQVAHAELQYWFNSADFIVAGSHYEGSGVAVCEALSCGCVPVLTQIPSFIKMTANGSCGWLYEAGNIDQLLAALKQTLTIDLEEKRHQVLRQFNSELSFKAIAHKIGEVALTL